jgi:hypothetical protein
MSSDETATLEREIVRTHVWRRDFHKASQFINAAKACANNVVREALLISALVSYTRPFARSGTRRRASAQLLEKLAFAEAQDTTKTLHDRLIVLRKKAVADTDPDEAPVQLEPTRRGQSSRMMFTPRRFHAIGWNVLKEDIDLAVFGRLANEMHRHCGERLLELSDQLCEAEPFFQGRNLGLAQP